MGSTNAKFPLVIDATYVPRIFAQRFRGPREELRQTGCDPRPAKTKRSLDALGIDVYWFKVKAHQEDAAQRAKVAQVAG